jgi:hypothetical protein
MITESTITACKAVCSNIKFSNQFIRFFFLFYIIVFSAFRLAACCSFLFRMAGLAACCSFLFRMAGLAASCSFLFRMAERETNQRERATGCISEAKNRTIFPKTGKRPPLRSG